MPPIDVPITSRRWLTPSPSVTQPMLGLDHVDVAVARELRAQPVARLARLAVADVVGQDDEVLRGVERLPGPEQLAGERRGPTNCAPVPPVPCITSTALRTTPCASFRGVPNVR